MVTESSRPGETEAALSNSADNLKLTSSLSGLSDNRFLEDDLRVCFEAVFGGSIGRAHMSVGSGPHAQANGKYVFAAFTPSSFAWPDQADALVDAILRVNATGKSDVYVCPNLMKGLRRTKGAAVARWTVHADVDDEVDLDLVRRVGGWAVASGSEGHGHVYVSLTESIPAHWHEALCLGLKDFMGATDPKISDNDVLRPPGSVNHKGPVFRTGPATVATFLIRPDESRQDPYELAAALGVSLPTSSTSGKRITPKKQVTPTLTIGLDNLPPEVQDALDDTTNDRSKDTMRIVGACYDAGVSLDKTRGIVASRKDLAGRLEDRDDDDVQACWLNAADSRQERKLVTPLLHRDSAKEGASSVVPPRIRPVGTTGSAEVTSAPPAFQRLDLAALLSPDRPPREWVVHGLIPAGTSVSIVAAAGTGKSLLMLAMSISIARGYSDFAGYSISRRRRVFLLDMENTENDLADRFTSLGIRAGDVDDLSDLVLIHLPGLAALDTSQGAQQLKANLDAYGIKEGDVVVLDSLQRVIDGPENDADTLRAFYRHTGIMLKRLGITVIRTDNTGKDPARNARGSSGKRDDVDLELVLTRDAQDQEQLTLKPGKSRLPDIKVVRLTCAIDELTGHLRYIGSGDPFAARLAKAVVMLDELELPLNISEAKANEALQKAGANVVRTVLRAALKQRKNGST
jgi:KaiC/GvpD/RAD55 family RecA-like ATPase